MCNGSKQLIVFAWTIEIVAVFCGVLNSGYTTFGANLPNALAEYIVAIPMAILALAELGRVPLASALFHKHRLLQAVALVGIAALGYLAVENWTFGFERIVDMRLKVVNVTRSAFERAREESASLQTAQGQKNKVNDRKREELRRGVEERNAGIAELTAQLNREPEIHQKNLQEILNACRIIRDQCILPRSQREDQRFKGATDQLNVDLRRLRGEKNELLVQIDALVVADAREGGDLEQKRTAAELAVNETRAAWHAAMESNQIFRLAASWYGVNTVDVTAEQFAAARWVFSTFSAIAIALAGTIAALVHYARNRAPGAPSLIGTLMAKIARAVRAYYARKRRPVVRMVPGPERVIYRDGKEPPVVVEKEVPRFVDRIVLIPRWGVRSPTYINSLIPRHERTVQPGATGSEAGEVAANVTPLNRKAN